MKKGLLTTLSLIMTFLLIGANVIQVNASTLEENTTKIKVYESYVTIPYNSNEIYVEYESNEEEVRAIIRDKDTGEIIDIFGEVISDSKELSSTRGYYKKTVYREKTVGPTTSRLYAVLDCYNYSSFRQINGIDDTYWSEASSGDWVLERDKSYGYVKDPSSSGAGTAATISGTANIVITTTSNTSGAFSLESLKGFGFTVEHSSGSTYYARTPIEFDYTYSLY